MVNKHKVGDKVMFAKAVRKGSDYVIADREGEIVVIDGANFLIEFEGIQYKKTLAQIR